jgi:hypothetical protein
MKLCLTCKFVSPGTALFCGRCQRSFGGRLCRKLHLSPRGSLYCVECGHSELTEPTSYVTLGTMSRPIAWLVILIAVSVIGHHLAAVAAALWNVMTWCLSAVFGVSGHTMIAVAERVASWIAVLIVISLFLPQQTGKAMRSWIARCSVLAIVAGWKAVVLLTRLVIRLAEGSRDHGTKTSKKKS